MKFFHLSDLHLGLRLKEYSLLEDQRFILDRIAAAADAERPDAVVIAGDVYDKSVPPAEAVQLFDDFLVKLIRLGLKVLVISGNHDSPERVAFASRLLNGEGLYISPVYTGAVAPVTLTDAFGPVDFYLLPFVKPAHVRKAFPDAEIESFTDALETAVGALGRNDAHRSVLVTHQFVTGAARCDSEDISVGGADNVDARVFEGFDYVALGHIHGPQNVCGPRVRYCGTPLKYSFSEAGHRKSVTVVTLAEKGAPPEVCELPLTPLRDLRELRGSFAGITAAAAADEHPADYLRITLTDEDEIPDAVGKLRRYYKNLMYLGYDNTRTRASGAVGAAENAQRRSPFEIFAEFYEKQNGLPMNEAQAGYVKTLMERMGEEDR